MFVEPGREKLEITAECFRQGGDAVALDRQSAASRRAIRTEGGEDQVPAHPQHPPQRAEVAIPFGGVHHEVERGAVMPEVEAVAEVVSSDVSVDPGGLPGKPIRAELLRLDLSR